MYNFNPEGRPGGLRFTFDSIINMNAKTDNVKARISEKLELDESQNQELDILLNSITQITRDSKQKNREVLAKVTDLIVDPKFDRDTARAVVADVTATYESKVAEAVANFGNLYDAMNETQRNQLRAFAANRRWHPR